MVNIDKNGDIEVVLGLRIRLSASAWMRANGVEPQEIPEDVQKFIQSIFDDAKLDGVPARVEVTRRAVRTK